MSLSVSCTNNVSVKEVSVNNLEKAALTGAKEAGKKLLLSLLEVTEKTVARDRSCEWGGSW